MMLGAVGYGCGEGGVYDCSLFQSMIGKLKDLHDFLGQPDLRPEIIGHFAAHAQIPGPRGSG